MDASPSGEIAVQDLPGDRWLVTLTGEHDLATAETLRERLTGIYKTGTAVVVDLSTADFIDSSILAVLLEANQLSESSACEHLGLVITKDTFPERLLRLVGALRMLETFRSVEEALAAFDTPETSSSVVWQARKRRIIKNEQTFRDYNNRRMQSEAIDATDDHEPIPFICECGSSDCIQSIMVTAAQFSEAHAAPNLFLVKPGHVYPDLERVVSEHETFAIVEKHATLLNSPP
jgi:anti-anti-sigma factor